MKAATPLDALRGHASRRGTAPALEFEGRTFCFADLEGGANAAARALSAHGVLRGERVAVVAGSSLEFVLAVLGAWKLGAIALPMNPAYREGELEALLAVSRPRVVVADRDVLARLRAVAPDSVRALLEIERGAAPGPARAAPAGRSPGPRATPFYPAVRKASVAPLDVDVRADEPALLLFTSGTTGRPKGALLTHGNLLAGARGLIAAWSWTQADRLLSPLPLFHVHGLIVAAVTSLVAGGSLVLHARFAADAVLDALAGDGVTLLFGVPTHHARLLDALAARRAATLAAPALRLAVSGSAPPPQALAARFEAAAGRPLLDRYGMTETLITLAPRADAPPPQGSVGWPLEGVEARVVRDDGAPAADGEDGELEVRGATLGPGYFADDAATAACRRAGWFRTGDLARREVDGSFSIVGRKKDLIITGGLKVAPGEVEEALLSHSAVAEACVYGMPNADLGEAVTAAVVLRAEAQCGAAELIEHCRERLAGFKKPKAIRCVTELPRNALGKVDRGALRGA